MDEIKYKIYYFDEKDKITSSIGKDIKAGKVELSWFDIKKASIVFINKSRYVLRYEYIEDTEVKKDG